MGIKLYLDEDITAASHLAATLRQRGFDVVSTVEAGNRTLDDRSQFAYALPPPPSCPPAPGRAGRD